MKEYFTNKSALIGILSVLFGISISDIILTVIYFKEGMTYIPNYGAAFVTAILSALLIIFALKGKDRLFYIICGGWLAYFVLNQLFALPGLFADLSFTFEQSSALGIIGHFVHIASVIAIIAIGGLLVEYMNDGTIYNKAFNILCVFTFVMLVILVLVSINSIISYGHSFPLIALLYDLSRLAMLFLFTHFAYDSAKTQLSKTQL